MNLTISISVSASNNVAAVVEKEPGSTLISPEPR